MPKNSPKKLVYVSEDILEEISNITKTKNIPVGKFIEDTLTQAIVINKTPYTLKDIIDFFHTMQTHKVLGGIFTPSNIISPMIKKLWDTDSLKLQNIWHESGNWYGTYCKEKFQNPINELATLLRMSRWDLNEIEVNQQNQTTNIRCISTLLSPQETILLAKFIEGYLNALQCEIKKIETLKGIILIETQPKKQTQ